MATHDNAPPPPDWQPEPRPCRRGECICETPQHALFIHGDEHLILGEN